MKKGITLAGNLIVDHNKEVDTYPGHSTLVSINRTFDTLGGLVCNSGIGLARLDENLPVHALGLVGNDSDGDYIISQMKKYPNINCDQIFRGNTQTSFSDVIADVTNHTRTFFSFKGTNSELGPEHFDFDKIETDILHIGYILLLDKLDSFDAEFGTKMARVLHDAQAAGIKTSIDVVTEQSDRFQKIVPHSVKYTDYCILNEEEASRTVGIEVRNSSGQLLVDVCKELCQKLFDLGVKEWVVIHAREGGIGLDNKGNFAVKPALNIPSEKIKGTTGAGDAFLSGVLYGAWKGYSIEKSVELGIGTSNASIIEEGPTNGILPENEIWDFYNSMEKETWPGFEQF